MNAPVRLPAEAAAPMAAAHAEAFHRPWSADDIAALAASPAVAAFGIEEGGALAGFVLVQAAGGDAEILTLAVRPPARRRGLGLALVEAAAGHARGAGAAALWLEVAEDNAAATALYRLAGFDVAGRRKGYYRRESGVRVDALMMRRTLNMDRGSSYSP